MTDDLIRSLRRLVVSLNWPVCAEAADEIERLRGEVERLRKALGFVRAAPLGFSDQNDAWAARKMREKAAAALSPAAADEGAGDG